MWICLYKPDKLRQKYGGILSLLRHILRLLFIFFSALNYLLMRLKHDNFCQLIHMIIFEPSSSLFICSRSCFWICCTEKKKTLNCGPELSSRVLRESYHRRSAKKTILQATSVCLWCVCGVSVVCFDKYKTRSDLCSDHHGSTWLAVDDCIVSVSLPLSLLGQFKLKKWVQ